MNKDFFILSRPISADALRMWEDILGIVLPLDYKFFLMNYGKCVSEHIYFENLVIGKSFWPASWVGIDDSDEHVIRTVLNANTYGLYYPIATDLGGAGSYISLNQEDYGSVHISNWDDYDDEKEEYVKFKVADTFEEFINGLQKEKGAEGL